MRRLACLFVLTVAACTSGGGDPGPPPNSITARFVPGGDVSVVEVTAVDRQALRQAELIAPTGQVVPAYSIDTTQSPRYDTYQPSPSVGLGVGLGSSGRVGTGLGLSFPLGSLGTETTTSVGQVVSNASLRLPDPVFYRQTWRDWRVRLRFGEPPGEVRFVTLDAPAPPP